MDIIEYQNGVTKSQVIKLIEQLGSVEVVWGNTSVVHSLGNDTTAEPTYLSPKEKCFFTIRKALDESPQDFCIIVACGIYTEDVTPEELERIVFLGGEILAENIFFTTTETTFTASSNASVTWCMPDGTLIVGTSVNSSAGLDGTLKTVKIIDNFAAITTLTVSGQLVETVNVEKLTNLELLTISSNPLAEVKMPIANSTTIDLNINNSPTLENIDLSGVELDNLSAQDCLLLEVATMGTVSQIESLGSINMDNTDIRQLNLSRFQDVGNINLTDCTFLEKFIAPTIKALTETTDSFVTNTKLASFDASWMYYNGTGLSRLSIINNSLLREVILLGLGLIRRLVIQNNISLMELDLSQEESERYFLVNNDLHALTMPINNTQICVNFSIQNNPSLSGTLDFSTFVGLTAMLEFFNTSITQIVLPALPTTTLKTINGYNANLEGINLLDMPLCCEINNAQYNFYSNGMTQSEVDSILEDLDTLSSGVFTGRAVRVQGNSTPSNSVINSTIPSLQGKGWFVNWDV